MFGAGVVYMLRLMARPPEAGETGPEAEPGPIRTAGITPAPQVDGIARPRRDREATMAFDLSVAWALILAFAICVYVVLDGFDLGIGMLYPFFPEKRDRDLMMNAVAPVWDGNETWLVLGGGGLMAAFPLAYAIIMPAVYPPVIAMLLALIFRGVAFEFRWRAVRPRTKLLWDWAFIVGSRHRGAGAGHHPRRDPAGHRRRGPRLRRRLVGLADAVQPPLRLRGRPAATRCSAPAGST